MGTARRGSGLVGSSSASLRAARAGRSGLGLSSPVDMSSRTRRSTCKSEEEQVHGEAGGQEEDAGAAARWMCGCRRTCVAVGRASGSGCSMYLMSEASPGA